MNGAQDMTAADIELDSVDMPRPYVGDTDTVTAADAHVAAGANICEPDTPYSDSSPRGDHHRPDDRDLNALTDRHWQEPGEQSAAPLVAQLQAALGIPSDHDPDPSTADMLKLVRELRAGAGERAVVDRLDGLLAAMIAGAGCTTQASVQLRQDLCLTRELLATINAALIHRRLPIAQVTEALHGGEPLL